MKINWRLIKEEKNWFKRCRNENKSNNNNNNNNNSHKYPKIGHYYQMMMSMILYSLVLKRMEEKDPMNHFDLHNKNIHQKVHKMFRHHIDQWLHLLICLVLMQSNHHIHNHNNHNNHQDPIHHKMMMIGEEKERKEVDWIQRMKIMKKKMMIKMK